MKKSVLLFLISLFFVSCIHLNERAPSGASVKPRHIVITVHGLTGNELTFGYLTEATQNYLTQLKPNSEIITKNFIYPTGRNENNGAFEFATGPKGLGAFIKEQFKDRPLTANDKISLVGHSQGGIISYIWFFSTILENGQDFEYIKHIDSIITLGTPFWGSKIASILTDKRNPDLIPFFKLFAPDDFKMTRREVSDLAFASDTINTFRTLAIKMDTDQKLSDELEKLPVRLINIIGLLPKDRKDLFSMQSQSGALVSNFNKKIINVVYDIFTKSYRGNKRVESDIAVPVPSSRWNFIYTKPKIIQQDLTVSSNEYKHFSHLVEANRSRFYFTESAHLPFDSANTLSMAYVDQSCLKIETCNHPTFRYVLNELANCDGSSDCDPTARKEIIEKLRQSQNEQYEKFKLIEQSLESFSAQINIKLKPGKIDQFPIEYFIQTDGIGDGGFSGIDSWQFSEYSLQKKVIDLKTDSKTQVSSASTKDYSIVFGDKNEKHSVDIVSRKATREDPFDRLRIHITGRVEDHTGVKNKSYVAPVDIKIPHLPVVQLNMLVQPSYSTFTELDYTK